MLYQALGREVPEEDAQWTRDVVTLSDILTRGVDLTEVLAAVSEVASQPEPGSLAAILSRAFPAEPDGE